MNGSYVVTNGDREIRIVSAEKIRNSKPVNWYIDENNKIQMFGAQTADLSFLFENLKTVMLPQYENEYRMLERNYEKLRRVINA